MAKFNRIERYFIRINLFLAPLFYLTLKPYIMHEYNKIH
jgi:hypothetical protein